MKKTIKKGLRIVRNFQCTLCSTLWESDEYTAIKDAEEVFVYDTCPLCAFKESKHIYTNDNKQA